MPFYNSPISGGSISNALPHNGQSIRNRKRGPTDLSASLELSGFLRNSDLLRQSSADKLVGMSLKSSNDSFSHLTAHMTPYQATLIPQLPSVPSNLQFYSSAYPVGTYNPGKKITFGVK